MGREGHLSVYHARMVVVIAHAYVGNVFLTCPTIHRHQTTFTYLFTLYYADIKNLMKIAILIKVTLNSDTFFKCFPVVNYLNIIQCISKFIFCKPIKRNWIFLIYYKRLISINTQFRQLSNFYNQIFII